MDFLTTRRNAFSSRRFKFHLSGKRLRGLLILAALLLQTGVGAPAGFAQDYSKIISAFQNSYLHEAAGDLSAAITDLKNAYDEDSYEINLRLGWLSYSLGLFSDAQSYYNKAILLKPFGVEARFGIVLPQSAMGNWTSVISQYEKILEIMPNNSTAMHRLGLIYYGKNEYAKAERYFEKVVNLYPFDYDALVMLAWTNYRLKKYREAKILFNKALMNTPSGVSAMEGQELMK
ncbi:Tetratricopeptide TPR_2 repeat protein [Chloroherpeton thalassium ATCC 35110]|uniref:Tetratricopeptide TPR_2 repeat protein n=1 Tax=Chloroherpeton thalassium (strain ATCC 35110 / GB-78) TaxID=517418 RepID=B3QUA8_CHLT3|nr:tetratricopeptide repeat protein [Chloroherpeton thalassium]ACF14357.1 Tetratricopeptide TPR_2 repeat protein [Chloroherpeton thalassium ATCC 35110]